MVERPDGLRCEFGYDPFARRVTKKVTTTESTPAGSFGASSTRTLWDGDVPVHTIEDDRRGNKLQRVERTLLFEETGFAPIAARQDEAPWLHCVATPAGALDALLTSAGELVERASTSAWGVAGTTASLGGVGLAGQVTDSEIGISYNRYRYYDPEAARFISPDPLGLAGGLNSFRYVPNVFGWSDPYGLDWNYRLRDANGSVYYVGRADDKATENAVMARHERTVGTTGARFGPTDTLERINGSVSRDAAMGVEHAGIVLGGTRTCPRRAKGQPKGSTPVRGNTDEGIGQEKLQTPEGQARLEAGLRVLKGSDPSTSTPVSRWRRDDSGRAVPA
jgi:RHS repeat-associated protein